MATIVIITACWYAVISSRVSPYNLSSYKNKLPLLHLGVLKYIIHWPADMQGGTSEDALSGATQHAHVLDGGGAEDDQGWSGM